ncbi:MAG: hypothetical protein V3W07_01150 [Syntrophobacteria bacterium]
MAVLPCVLGCRTLRRTVQVRLGSNPLRLPGGPAIFTISRRQFVNYPGYSFPILTFQHWSIPKSKKGETLDDFDACFLSTLW